MAASSLEESIERRQGSRPVSEMRFTGDMWTLTPRDLERFDPLQGFLMDLCEEDRKENQEFHDFHHPRGRAAEDIANVQALVQPNYYGLLDKWHQEEI